ncbi:MAG: YicC family protein [Thiotrichales bacterium]|nr:YicC family protein [Thiotrichales bacterium]
MLRSMTAFARIESLHETGGIQWEIRSVNHRYLDVNLRLPEDFRRLDPKVRERIGTRLNRGKVDCTLRVLPGPTAASGLAVDDELAARVAQAARAVADLLPEAAPVNPVDVLRWPGVVQAPAPDPELMEHLVLGELDRVLADLVAMREREGARMETVIRSRLDDLETEVSRVREVLPAIVRGFGERMRARLAEVDATLDEGRLEQEIALIAQRMDVAEELDRLEAHVHEIRSALARPEPAGRRLDFLMQELNREANTLGSKSAAVTTSRASIDLKVLIEQMREQIQNVE